MPEILRRFGARQAFGRRRKAGCFNLAVSVFAVACLATPAAAQSPSRDYVPDETFTGTRLTGWVRVGGGNWSARDGEIRASGGAKGGLLLAPKSLQDAAVYSRFHCTDPCRAGIVVRVERTPGGGYRGFLVPLAGHDVFSVTWDRAGTELARHKLPRAFGFARFMPPAGGVPAGGPPSVPGVDAPKPAGTKAASGALRLYAPLIPIGGSVADATPPPPAPESASWAAPTPAPFHADAWHEISIIVDANIVRATRDWNRATSAATDDEAQGFGPYGLYVAPGTQVRFRQVSDLDLGNQSVPAEILSPRFRMQQLDSFDYGWDAAVADINRDGFNDIVAGPFYYLGPGFTRRREYYLGNTFSPGTQFNANMISFAQDFTGDGWPDILATENRQMALYVNPRGAPRRWTRHLIAPGIQSEIVLLRDIDGDGMPELVFEQGGRLAFAKPDPADPTKPWPVFLLSEPGTATVHGLGVGDINGDGRPDILQVAGWWEQPAAGATSALWEFHANTFAPPSRSEAAGGGEMSVVDVNGDGLNDVIASLNAHGFGLAWFEQKRAPDGSITFATHMIMGDYSTINAGGLTFSELHAGAVAADIDRDGVIDFVTGKRHWSHLDSYIDPDPNGPAYLVWYKGIRSPDAPGGVEFMPEIIHNRSGVGSAVKVIDIDKDGELDIVTSGSRGTYVFFGKPTPIAQPREGK